MIKIRSSNITKCGWDMGKLDYSYTAGGNVKYYSHSGNILAVS